MDIPGAAREAAERALDVVGAMRGAPMLLRPYDDFVEPEMLPERVRDFHAEAMGRLGGPPAPMPWPEVEHTLREEWEERPSSVLEDVEEEPAAMASVGQVHRATLDDGREVALKVQRPGAGEAVRNDLQSLGLVLELGRVMLPGLDARALGAELRERVSEELDFEWVAQTQRRFARAFRRDPAIHIPAPVTDLCRPRVLVSEWVAGRPFSEVVGLGQEQRDRYGAALFAFHHGALHRHGLCHANPHPGNHLLMEDGRVAIVAFGVTREVADPEVPPAELFPWLHEERQLDAPYVRSLIEGLSPGALVPPAEQLWPRRMYASLTAVLAQLQAKADWPALARA